jgi:hypothetical protein
MYSTKFHDDGDVEFCHVDQLCCVFKPIPLVLRGECLFNHSGSRQQNTEINNNYFTYNMQVAKGWIWTSQRAHFSPLCVLEASVVCFSVYLLLVEEYPRFWSSMKTRTASNAPQPAGEDTY